MDYLTLLPHKYPFLFIDRIISCQPGKAAQGIWRITAENEYLVKINEKIIFPSTLLLEAMAQVGAIAILSDDKYKDYRTFLSGIDQTIITDSVTIGDELIINSQILKIKGQFGKRKGEVLLNGKIIVSSISTFALTK